MFSTSSLAVLEEAVVHYPFGSSAIADCGATRLTIATSLSQRNRRPFSAEASRLLKRVGNL